MSHQAPLSITNLLDLSTPRVMGILNATPDSFFDGGQLFTENNGVYSISLDTALCHAEKMSKQGASIIDIGGESTRPGAALVSVQEELDRVIPIVEALHCRLDILICVDTSKPQVMEAAADSGAAMINDIRALNNEAAMEIVQTRGLLTCLMHMQGEPGTMQANPQYDDVVKDVYNYLQFRASACIGSGISPGQILIDPGFGFGKTVQQNFKLLNHLEHFKALGYPLLVGISRKSMLGQVTGKEVENRVSSGISAAVHALIRGASIIRTHDVSDTMDAIRIHQAVIEA